MSRPQSRSSLTGKASKSSSRSGSDASSHVSLNSTDWNDTMRAIGANKPISAARSSTPDLHRMLVTVDHTGELRAEKSSLVRTMQVPQSRIKTLTPQGRESAAFLRLRQGHSRRRHSDEGEGFRECVIEKATGKSIVGSKHRKIFKDRQALAADRGLQKEGDRYAVWARSSEQFGWPNLYETADTDEILEWCVHDISEHPFRAERGIMRMPLKTAKSAKRVIPEEPYLTTSAPPSDSYVGHTELIHSKEGKKQHVRRADIHTSKYPLVLARSGSGSGIAERLGSNACEFGQALYRSASFGNYSSRARQSAVETDIITRHESLAIHGTKDELTHIDMRTYPWKK